MSVPMRLLQVSVPLPPELRAFVERAAEREDRSLAAQIRHYVAAAARRAGVERDRDGDQADGRV
jgi:hypothetical protein